MTSILPLFVFILMAIVVIMFMGQLVHKLFTLMLGRGDESAETDR